MTSKELEKLKKQVEKERKNSTEANEIKELRRELSKYKHKSIVKFAVNTQKIAKILGNVFKGLGKQLSEYEKKMEKQKKEQGIDPKKQNDDVDEFIMEM